MSESTPELQEQIEKAAGIVTGSQGSIGVAKAMELMGFSAEQRSNMRLYQQVRRRAGKLSVVEVEKEKATPPPAEVLPSASAGSTASSLTEPSSRSKRAGHRGQQLLPLQQTPPT